MPTISRISGINFLGPQSVAVTASGTILIVDAGPDPAHPDEGEIATVFAVTATGSSIVAGGSSVAGRFPLYAGDDGLATNATLVSPTSVAPTPDGGFLIVDEFYKVVRKVSSAGVITRVAGTAGVSGGSGDDGNATDAQFNDLMGVASTGDGGFLVADTNNDMVRKVSAQGTITRVAGYKGARPNVPLEGLATEVPLSRPTDVEPTADGGFLISDTGNSVIRKVSADGSLTTVAGTLGVSGSGGDDGLATAALLSVPRGLAVTADGGFLIADSGNQVVRKVGADGVITRVAGITGVAGNGGDGGPATSAQLSNPLAVAVGPEGYFLIADERNRAVRRVG